MKREIKFRAWIVSEKRMEEWNQYFFDDSSIVTGYSGIFPTDNGYDVELMQYTGLKDKNGKEIYEGDICQALQGEQQKPKSFYPVKSRVTFWKGSFEFFSKSLSSVLTDDNGCANNILWCWHGHNNLPDIYEEINTIEVIGNIYENPELLK